MVITLHQAGLVILLCTLCSALSASAQIPLLPNICGTDEHTAKLLTTDNTYRRFYERAQAKSNRTDVDTTTLYTVPVIFVVYHRGEPVGSESNLSDADLQAALNTLNRNFARQDPKERYGVNTKIQFALARRTPGCRPFNGIVRVDARSVPGYEKGLLFGDFEQDKQLRALAPEYAHQLSDGAIIVRVLYNTNGAGAWAFYGGNVYVKFRDLNQFDPNLGIFTHEMGHSLNLFHTFLGSEYAGGYTCPPNSNPETDGDQVADTDPHIQYAFYYPGDCSVTPDLTINPCTGRPYGLIGHNFMSYGCERLFTQGQVVRMRAYLQTSNLLNSVYLTAPGESEVIQTACVPTYVVGGPYSDGIWRVEFGQLVNESGFSNTYNLGYNYFDYSCGSRIAVTAGQTYPLKVLARGRQRRAYIDYNNDGIFDESTERVLAIDSGVNRFDPDTTFSSVTIPTTAVANRYLRMRIIVDGGSTPPTACSLPGASYGSGEAEDYGVMILSDPSTCSPMRTVRAGNWTDASVWSCGRLPRSTDSVEILHRVTLPAGSSNQANRLMYGPGGKLNLEVGARLLLDQ